MTLILDSCAFLETTRCEEFFSRVGSGLERGLLFPEGRKETEQGCGALSWEYARAKT